jgi:CNT family concentrative nucleoside transporter
MTDHLRQRLISFLGLLTMIALAWLLSDNRRKMNFRLILSGVALQLVLGLLLLGTALRQKFFDLSDVLFAGLIGCAHAGAEFVFGEGFREHYFAFGVMPMVIFVSSLTAVLFYVGVLQWAVRIMARVMVWVMDTTGAESLCASANVLLGMTTAPLTVRPYLQTMTRSEIMAMMTGGMATAAGSTLPAYVAYGADPGHLMVASLMSAPAALVIAKIMVPEMEESLTRGTVRVEVARTDANVLDAACRGAAEGLKLVLNIVAMLIAFIALVHLANWILSPLPHVADGPITLQRVFGWLCAPLAWIMGVTWKDAHTVGLLIAEKTVFNEMIAFKNLQGYREVLSPRSFTIATYALCGFANFGSIGVMIGGVSGLAPNRRKEFAKYGFRSMIGGALAAFMTAAIAGMLI